MTTRNILSGPTPPAGDGSGNPDPSAGDGDRRHGAEGDISPVDRIRSPIDPERDLACCRLPLTDLGNAERWRVRFGDAFRFCPEIGWFGWDGRRWKLLSEEKDAVPAEVMVSVYRTVRAIRNEAALVAASGYPTEYLTKKDLADLEGWADRHGASSRELYLRGDEDGARARWLEQREPMDEVLGKSLWSHKIAAWAKTSEGVGKLVAIAKLAKAFDGIAVRPDAFDRDPMAINVMNGTLRLERDRVRRTSDEVAAGKSAWKVEGWRVRLHPHDRADMLTKLAPVKYSARAKCPAYDTFLARVQDDPAMRRFLHQWGGYSLTGDTGEHKLAFFYGEGRNGKGTWVEAVAHLAGDYGGSIGIESLIDSGGKRRGDQATPDLAELPGVRFLRVSEPSVGMTFNDGLLKQLTGGDPVKARHLNKGFFEFFPQFKLSISGNRRPGVKDVSHGFWARLMLVPWDVIIGEDEIDRTLPEKLRGEASGILNRLIEGLIDWRTNGLSVPVQVTVATRAYRESSDLLGRFLSDCCVVGDDHSKVRVGAGMLWEVFQAWVAATGSSEWKRAGFVKAMEDRKFIRKTSNGVWWLGVMLRPGVTLDAVKSGAWTPADLPDDDMDGPTPPAGGGYSGNGVARGQPAGGSGGAFRGDENDDFDPFYIDGDDDG